MDLKEIPLSKELDYLLEKLEDTKYSEEIIINAEDDMHKGFFTGYNRCLLHLKMFIESEERKIC